jgi:hypothetical protein
MKHGSDAILFGFLSGIEEAIHLSDGDKMVNVSEKEKIHHSYGWVVEALR